MAQSSMAYILERAETAALLTHEEELRLGRTVQGGQAAKKRLDGRTSTDRRDDRKLFEAGKAARDELVVRNVRLAQNVARRYRLRSGGDVDDLFMYGVLGLFRAAELFDPGKNFRFSTYAVLWIRQSINASLGDTSHPMHVPYPQQLKEIRLRAHVSEDGMNIPDAAVAVGMNRSTAYQLLAACSPVVSFDQPVGGEPGGRTLGETVSSPDDCTFGKVEDKVAGNRQLDTLASGLSYLDGQERTVMAYFLDDDRHEMPTLDEVADATGMPTTLVRSKRLSARSKLAHPAARIRQQLRSAG